MTYPIAPADRLAFALAAAQRGFHVYPMAGESDHTTPKRPHWCLGSDGGYKHGTTNEAQIREWNASLQGV